MNDNLRYLKDIQLLMSCMMHHQWKYFPFRWMRLVTRGIKRLILWSWLPTMMESAPHGDLPISQPRKIWNRQPIRRIPLYDQFMRMPPPISASGIKEHAKMTLQQLLGPRACQFHVWQPGWYKKGYRYCDRMDGMCQPQLSSNCLVSMWYTLPKFAELAPTWKRT